MRAIRPLRLQVVDVLGGKCVDCGYKTVEEVLRITSKREGVGKKVREKYKNFEMYLQHVASTRGEWDLVCPTCLAVRQLRGRSKDGEEQQENNVVVWVVAEGMPAPTGKEEWMERAREEAKAKRVIVNVGGRWVAWPGGEAVEEVPEAAVRLAERLLDVGGGMEVLRG